MKEFHIFSEGRQTAKLRKVKLLHTTVLHCIKSAFHCIVDEVKGSDQFREGLPVTQTFEESGNKLSALGYRVTFPCTIVKHQGQTRQPCIRNCRWSLQNGSF